MNKKFGRIVMVVDDFANSFQTEKCRVMQVRSKGFMQGVTRSCQRKKTETSSMNNASFPAQMLDLLSQDYRHFLCFLTSILGGIEKSATK